MKSVTMKNFNSDVAWERRFDVPVSIGAKLVLEQTNEYEIVGIDMPEDRDHNCPWYTLIPINKTLKEYQKEYDKAAKRNYRMTVGEYPDFSFKVEALWFFSRNVMWE